MVEVPSPLEVTPEVEVLPVETVEALAAPPALELASPGESEDEQPPIIAAMTSAQRRGSMLQPNPATE